ncbi:DUF4099 domain-containing protein [Paramuribaculum intestinale]|uniref:DUF4099 domain-containing protein n=1 Tax=Paramuribaculum intestinale TaxID=2094151 RepID=UPI0025B17AC9|nr:DUF4099 domain-containing protein [Paramuribaculum intestinale]
MAQDQNLEEVLIARNNDTGQVGAVTGLNEDGTPKMTDVKSAKLSDLVKFSKGQNPLEAFMSNFVRQCKNPSIFGFFKVPADRYDSVGMAMADFAKDPDANAEILKDFKVEVPQQEQKQAETPEQKPAAESQTKEQSEPKFKAVDESKVDWQMLKEKWGIDKEALEASGDLKEMLYNRKSKPVNITPTFGGEKFNIEARLSFRTAPDGSVKLVPHFIQSEQKLDEFMGYKFDKIDQANLKENGNLGRIVELTDPATGEKVPSLISRDRYTNELLAIPAKDVKIRDIFGQTKLTMPEIMTLKKGLPLPPKEVVCRDGKTRTGILQYNVDRKAVEFVPNGMHWYEKVQHAKQAAEAKKEHKGETVSTVITEEKAVRKPKWTLKDGSIKPLGQWNKIPLTEQQKDDYANGRVAKLDNMVDEKGQPCTVYLYFDKEKQRPMTSLNDPRVKVANESQTQKAVNNDGLTNEATKNITDPLTKGQTQPKDDAQQKQQRKPKGPRL